MIQLRPYQQQLYERTQASMRAGHRAPLLVSPTGSGKTVMFSHMARVVSAKGKVVFILAHRDELVKQISDTLLAFDVDHSFVAAGRPYRRGLRVYVCSVMTLAKRLDKVPRPDVIIMDEAHHAVAGSWRKVANAYADAYRVGVTATPERLDGTGLGDVFDDMVLGPSVPELIELGALSPYRLFAPPSIDTRAVHTLGGDFKKNELARVADRPSVTGDAVDHYRRLAAGKRAVAFCVGVTHAGHVADEFRKAGFEAASIDGTMDPGLRADLVGKFRRGVIQVLTSVDLISEGFDLPAVEVAISLRPTQSLALWLQQAGRALRPFPGKDYALILDHAGNTERHGLPDDERAWTLEGAKRAKKGQGVPQLKVRKCPKCFATYGLNVQACSYVWPDGRRCDHVFKAEDFLPEQKDGELVEVDAAAQRKDFLRRRSAAKTLGELVEFAKGEGYRNPHVWAQRWMQLRQRHVGAGRA